MRVQCDGCERAVASVMCCADEAALCTDCDTRVHAANKLANKHQRVSLMGPKECPRCDICQEKSAFFFCLEDRALLCRDCDVSIHSSTALSSAHQRFLVPGTKVALEALSNSQEPPPEASSVEDFSRRPLSIINSPSMVNSPSAVNSPSITSKPSYHASHRPSSTASASFPCPPVKPSAVPQKMIGMSVPANQVSHGSRSHPGVRLVHGNGSQASVRHGSHGAPGSHTSHGRQMSHVSHGSQASHGSQGSLVSHGSQGSQVSHGSQGSQGSFDSHGSPPATNTTQAVHSDTPGSQGVHVVQGNGHNGVSTSMTRRSSISEFLSEAIPSWRVDELLNIPELAGGYCLGDIASSKADASNLGEYDWTADLSLFDEQVLYSESLHEVPQMSSSPPVTAVVSRPGRSAGATKGKAKQTSMVPEYDDAFVVPDLGLHSAPASPPVLKRRRPFVEV